MGDLAVAICDDTPLATTEWPELTTVRQPIADMAREAMLMLIVQTRGRRAGDAPEVTHKPVKFALIKRASSASRERGIANPCGAAQTLKALTEEIPCYW